MWTVRYNGLFGKILSWGQDLEGDERIRYIETEGTITHMCWHPLATQTLKLGEMKKNTSERITGDS